MKPDFSNLKGDVFGGVTAGVVALPLALAFGVQSGMGAISGLYGAIALGIFTAFFGGTNTQISGPTGPMTVVSAVVIAMAVESAGSLEDGMGMIVAIFLLAGLMQLLLGLARVGKYVKFIPYPVLSGFMSGIGVIIILFQLYPFMGHASAKSTIDILANIKQPISAINWQAMGLGAGTIAIIYLFPRITRAVPSALVALIVMSGISVAMGSNVAIIGDIPSGLPNLTISNLVTVDLSKLHIILEFAVTLAALGSIDSLLTSVVADNITKTRHRSNKELVGQGIGNMASALIGGIPGAGATMRTVVNINAGGKTRISGFIASIFLVIILFGAGQFAALIPKPVLAGILITVGVGIIDYRGFKHLTSGPRADALILLVVLLITVFGNLLDAVFVGMVMASILFMKKISDITETKSTVTSIKDFRRETPWDDEVSFADAINEKVFIKHLDGPLFFGFASKFQEMTEALPTVKIVVIRMEKVPYMDQSGLYAMEEAILDLERRDIVVALTSVQDQPMAMLKKIGIIPALVADSYIFPSFRGCAKWLQYIFSPEGETLEDLINELKARKNSKVAFRL